MHLRTTGLPTKTPRTAQHCSKLFITTSGCHFPMHRQVRIYFARNVCNTLFQPSQTNDSPNDIIRDYWTDIRHQEYLLYLHLSHISGARIIQTIWRRNLLHPMEVRLQLPLSASSCLIQNPVYPSCRSFQGVTCLMTLRSIVLLSPLSTLFDIS